MDERHYKVNADFGLPFITTFYFSYLDDAINMVYMIRDDDNIDSDLYEINGLTMTMINI